MTLNHSPLALWPLPTFNHYISHSFTIQEFRLIFISNVFSFAFRKWSCFWPEYTENPHNLWSIMLKKNLVCKTKGKNLPKCYFFICLFIVANFRLFLRVYPQVFTFFACFYYYFWATSKCCEVAHDSALRNYSWWVLGNI